MKYFLFLALVVFSSISFAQKAQVSQVTDQLFLIQGYGGNISFLVTDNGVMLVDVGMTKEQAEDVQKIIAEKTKQPLKYIVLTHYHWDHTNALPFYPTNVSVITHKNLYFDFKNISAVGQKNKIENELPKKIEDHKAKLTKLSSEKKDREYQQEDSLLKADQKTLDEQKAYTIRFPDLVYDDNMKIYMGKDTIELVHPGNGHTDGDTWVIFKNKNVIQLGDWYFEHRYPYIDNPGNCDIMNWSKGLKVLSQKSYSQFIPGHGNVSDGKGLVRLSEYLADLHKEIAACVKKGKSLDETKKEVKLEKYKDFEFPFFCQNIEAVYMSLKKAKK